MNQLNAQVIVKAMKQTGDPKVQLRQTEYRIKLAKKFQIQPDMKILEIGAGQGDMTAVLSACVGGGGEVVTVDTGSDEYGAPITLKDANDFIKSSPLGNPITFHRNTDILADDFNFPLDYFDGVVIAHAFWYMADLATLKKIITKVYSWTKHFYFAEWDLKPRTLNQIPHYQAALIQAEAACFIPISQGNIRTLITKEQLQLILNSLDCQEMSCTSVETNLQDGKWEVDYAIHFTPADLKLITLPASFRNLIDTQIRMLKTSEFSTIDSLDSFVLTAKTHN